MILNIYLTLPLKKVVSGLLVQEQVQNMFVGFLPSKGRKNDVHNLNFNYFLTMELTIEDALISPVMEFSCFLCTC